MALGMGMPLPRPGLPITMISSPGAKSSSWPKPKGGSADGTETSASRDVHPHRLWHPAARVRDWRPGRGEEDPKILQELHPEDMGIGGQQVRADQESTAEPVWPMIRATEGPQRATISFGTNQALADSLFADAADFSATVADGARRSAVLLPASSAALLARAIEFRFVRWLDGGRRYGCRGPAGRQAILLRVAHENQIGDQQRYGEKAGGGECAQKTPPARPLIFLAWPATSLARRALPPPWARLDLRLPYS